MRPLGLPLGAIQSPRANAKGPCLVRTRITQNGHVALRGALVPAGNLPGEPSLPIDNDGWVDTGVAAGIAGGEVRVGSARSGVARIGGLAFPRAALEEFLRQASSTSGAAVALQRDYLFGEAPRAGNGNLKTLIEALEEAGVSVAAWPRPDGDDARHIGVA
jgi:hypothetical protein